MKSYDLRRAEKVEATISTAGLATETTLASILSETDIPTTVLHGVTTVITTGTRVNIASNVAKSITIKADIDNTNTIYVGGSGVTSTNGFPLSAGDTLSLDISNTNKIWIDAAVSGESINWISNE